MAEEPTKKTEKKARGAPFVELNPRLRPVGSDGDPVRDNSLKEIRDPEWNATPKRRAEWARVAAAKKAEGETLKGKRVTITSGQHKGKTAKHTGGSPQGDIHVLSLEAPHRGWAYVKRSNFKIQEERVSEKSITEEEKRELLNSILEKRTGWAPYVGTVHGSGTDPKTKEKIALHKVLAKAKDAFSGDDTQRTRVRVRSRLGKDNPNADDYKRGGKHWRPSSMDIKREHGSRHDIYHYTSRKPK